MSSRSTPASLLGYSVQPSDSRSGSPPPACCAPAGGPPPQQWAGLPGVSLPAALPGHRWAVTNVGGDRGTWGFVAAAIVDVAAIAIVPGALQALVLGRGERW